MSRLAASVVLAMLLGASLPAAAEEHAAQVSAGAAPAGVAQAEALAWPLQEQLPPSPPPPPPITLVLKVDLTAQRLTVIEDGKAKHVWPVSSGIGPYATKTGTFRPQWASRMWRSRQYGFAPMPHSIFFNRGTAFHGTGAVGLLGRPASHGCIRLAPGNAAQLFKLVHKHGYAQTKIVVHGGSRAKSPAVVKAPNLRRMATSTQSGPRRGNSRSSATWPF